MALKYYVDMKNLPSSDLLIQANINTENQLMVYLILVGKIFQTLAEVQEHIISFIRVFQLTMAHMFQDQLLNKVQTVSTIQHVIK